VVISVELHEVDIDGQRSGPKVKVEPPSEYGFENVKSRKQRVDELMESNAPLIEDILRNFAQAHGKYDNLGLHIEKDIMKSNTLHVSMGGLGGADVYIHAGSGVLLLIKPDLVIGRTGARRTNTGSGSLNPAFFPQARATQWPTLVRRQRDWVPVRGRACRLLR
jgi:hypothetical protein